MNLQIPRRDRQSLGTVIAMVLGVSLGVAALCVGRARAAGEEVAFRDVTVTLASPSASPRPWVPYGGGVGPMVIYLATEGVTIHKGARSDATVDESPLCGAAIPAFDSTPFGASRAQVVASLAAKVASLFADFDVVVVTTRPSSGPYNLVAVGGRPDLCGLATGYSGYAPLDCQNAGSVQDVVFVFADGITHLGMLAVVIAHEVGHALGLPHTLEACDVMSNLLCNPDDKRFFDKTMAIAADHVGRCGLGKTANSHALLMTVLGPRGGRDGGVVVDARADGRGDEDLGDLGDLGDGSSADAGMDAGTDRGAEDVLGSPDASGTGERDGGCVIVDGMSLASNGGKRQLLWPGLWLGFLFFRRRRRRCGRHEVTR